MEKNAPNHQPVYIDIYIYITKQNYTMWESYTYRYYNPEKLWFDHVEWDSFMVTPRKVKRGKPGICNEKWDMISM